MGTNLLSDSRSVGGFTQLERLFAAVCAPDPEPFWPHSEPQRSLLLIAMIWKVKILAIKIRLSSRFDERPEYGEVGRPSSKNDNTEDLAWR